MKKSLLVLSVLSSALFLSSCATPPPPPPPPPIVQQAKAEQVVAMPQFGFNQYKTLSADDQASLKSVAESVISAKNAHIGLQVQGRADAVGSKIYNLNLGIERAQTVANFLIEQGVPASKISQTVSSAGSLDANAKCANVKNHACGAADRVVAVKLYLIPDSVLKGQAAASEEASDQTSAPADQSTDSSTDNSAPE